MESTNFRFYLHEVNQCYTFVRCAVLHIQQNNQIFLMGTTKPSVIKCGMYGLLWQVRSKGILNVSVSVLFFGIIWKLEMFRIAQRKHAGNCISSQQFCLCIADEDTRVTEKPEAGAILLVHVCSQSQRINVHQYFSGLTFFEVPCHCQWKTEPCYSTHKTNISLSNTSHSSIYWCHWARIINVRLCFKD